MGNVFLAFTLLSLLPCVQFVMCFYLSKGQKDTETSSYGRTGQPCPPLSQGWWPWGSSVQQNLWRLDVSFLERWMGYHGIFLLMALGVAGGAWGCTHTGSSGILSPHTSSLTEEAAGIWGEGWKSVGRGKHWACCGHLQPATRQGSRSPEGGAGKESGRRQLPSNRQQLEKGGGREGG